MSDALADATAAQRLAADPARSVWVAASAGTGKTKVLTDRVLSLLLAGTKPHRILCLTFTKAAAAEMNNRINDRLAAWAAIGDEALAADLALLAGHPAGPDRLARARRLFAQVLDTPGGMKIETIHAFCQALLRRFPLEAGLAPHFQVMDDRDAALALAEARDAVLIAARSGEDPALALAVETIAQLVQESGFLGLLAELAGARGRLVRMRERHGSLDGAALALAGRLFVAPDETPGDITARACEDEAFDAQACRHAVEALLAGSAADCERAGTMAAWLADPSGRAAGFAAWRDVFLTREGAPRQRLFTQKAAKAWDGLAKTMEDEAERLLRLAERLRSARILSATRALLMVADRLLDAYERHKAGRAMLDYDDLILSARHLLEQDGATAWVLYKLDGGIDHVLIDEAQDTNPDQWAVVRALTDEFFAGDGTRQAGARTVFAVGDAKQSIYSFQRADPAEFDAMRRRLGRRVPESGALWEEVALTMSFRSAPAVLDAVDLVFNGELGRVGVVGPGETLVHRARRAGAGGVVELWPPVEPRQGDERDPWRPPVERERADSPRGRLARLVGQRIRAMLDGEMLASKGRAIRPGDILVLVRRRNAFVEELVRELKARDVPIAGADRMVLAEQMAVMDLLALGQALVLPEDDLTLAAVLKGPLIGLSEEDLFALAWNRPGRLIEALEARSGEAPFAAARQRFERWRELARRLSVHEFYAAVLADGGKAALLGRLGPEAEDPLDEFVGLTLAFERAHPPSLQGFLTWMGETASELKRDLETGTGAVRIMTVHGAKGLQAPIVFLPDTLQAPDRTPPLLWMEDEEGELLAWAPRAADRDETVRGLSDAAAAARDREYRRLLYVAMTRAEDRLVVCGWNTQRAAPAHCWYDLIARPLRERGLEGIDPVLARAGLGEGRVWRLVSPQTAPIEASPADGGAAAAPPLPPWAKAAPPVEPAPARPFSPSRPEAPDPPVRQPLTANGSERHYRRGQLIHRLLQILPDLPTQARAAAAARFLGRSGWGLERAEQAEIALEVARVLDHPGWAAVFGPGSRAEVPVVGQVGERLIAGRIDRLLVAPDRVLVVDFKTNRSPPAGASAVPLVYLRQMAAYRALLASIYPGLKVQAALLWTDGPALTPLDPGLLDDALAGLA